MSFTVVRQHDERDCAAACLAMLARYHGLKDSIARFRELTKTDQRGTNLYGLVHGANDIGLDAEALSGEPDDLLEWVAERRAHLPFVAHIIENAMLHYVVVYKIKNNVFYLSDPARGRRRLSLEDFCQLWTGYIVAFRRTDRFRPGNRTRGGSSRFFALLKGQYAKLFGVLLVSLVISGIGIAGAFVFELVIGGSAQASHGGESGESSVQQDASPVAEGLSSLVSAVSEQTSAGSLTVIFGTLIGLYVLQAGIQFARGYLIVLVSKHVDYRLSLSYFHHIIDLPVSSVSLRKTGEYLSRFADATAIRTAISGAAVSLVLDTTMVLGCAAILYMQSALLFRVSLIIVILYAAVLLLYRRPIERSNRDVMEKNAILQSFLKEGVDGAATVKAAGARHQIRQTAGHKFSRFIDSIVTTSLISISQEALSEAVEAIGTVIILWLGFSMVADGTVSLGTLVTFYALLVYFVQPVKNLVELQPVIQKAFVAASRMNDILDLRTEEPSDVGAELHVVARWSMRDVDFRYGYRELVLKHVSLEVNRGEKVAIVGESGSGKTTLAKLLMRFYEPENGLLLADDLPLDSLRLSALRSAVAYVDQSTYLFADSIRENLRLGNPECTDEEISQACRTSLADVFIRDLPMGYDTPLDENGANLSGGQRQRLAIARALLKRPQLLILDEATSNLDTTTESAIKSAVFGPDRELTCIIIAHRLTTVADCDRIYVVDQGRVVECGKHDQLLARGGKYAELWENQGSVARAISTQ